MTKSDFYWIFHWQVVWASKRMHRTPDQLAISNYMWMFVCVWWVYDPRWINVVSKIICLAWIAAIDLRNFPTVTYLSDTFVPVLYCKIHFSTPHCAASYRINLICMPPFWIGHFENYWPVPETNSRPLTWNWMVALMWLAVHSTQSLWPPPPLLQQLLPLRQPPQLFWPSVIRTTDSIGTPSRRRAWSCEWSDCLND